MSGPGREDAERRGTLIDEALVGRLRRARPRRHVRGALALLDALAWAGAITVLAVARYDLTVSVPNRPGIAIAIAIAVVLQLASYLLAHRGRYRYGSTDEILALVMVAGLIMAVLVVTSALTDPRLIPLSVALASAPTALTVMVGVRWALGRLSMQRRRPAQNVHRALVIGGGAGGAQAIRMMLIDATSTMRPVGLLDDDPSKRHLRISGVRVLGTVSDLPAVAEQTQADVVIFAIPSATSAEVSRAAELAAAAQVEMKILPSTNELLAAPRRPGQREVELHTSTFRSLSLEDLLGRRAVDTDVDSIAGYLDSRVVLVTGAGGSIGSQLCREIAAYSPDRLVMTDRDESALHAVQLSIDGQAMLDSEDLVLGDLRSPGFIDRLIDTYRPDIVFHAAALKHLTLTERFPEEAFLTNVAATTALLQACAAHDVERFVHISTDKAADPTSVLGYSKRISERLTATVGQQLFPAGRYISVRFGNVLGSRGSALTSFAAQLESGLPLTITSPDMHRYFMSVHEACQLVLQAGAVGRTGEVLVLDMGEPHNVEQLARRFAALHGYRDVDVVYTHPRPGEKLVETRLGQSESDHRPHHPLITHVTAPLVDAVYLEEIPEVAQYIARSAPTGAVVEWMAEAALGAGSEPLVQEDEGARWPTP